MKHCVRKSAALLAVLALALTGAPGVLAEGEQIQVSEDISVSA